MSVKINLNELSRVSTPEKTVLSVYISGSHALNNLEKELSRMRAVLGKTDAGKDEREHFDENAAIIRKYLQKHPLLSGSLSIFSCWVLDFFKVYRFEPGVPVKDLIWYDSSPYIRPLAELLDEYENVAVVLADNNKSRVYIISLCLEETGTTIEGAVKNHVKKGGWSQQRYERRRDKQLFHYTKEISRALMELEKVEKFSRIILAGSRETLEVLMKHLPQRFKEMIKQKAVDLHKGEHLINQDLMELFREQERQDERSLWEKIKAEYLRNGLGIIGLEKVLKAVKAGQVEAVIFNRNLKITGRRCRDCENLEPGEVAQCANCGSRSGFSVDLINEIVELAEQTGAVVEFSDPIPQLDEAGGIAGLLRFKY